MEMEMERDAEDEVPEEIEDQCLQCHEALGGTDQLLKPVLETSRLQLQERLDKLDAASLTLLLAYTMNSLFWVYLCTQGVSPKGHPIQKELERLQKAMGRANILTEKRAGAQPRLNQGAAKRFVRGALSEQEKRKRRRGEEEEGAPPSKRPPPS